MKRNRKQKQQFECYKLAVSELWLGYYSCRTRKERDEYLNLALAVEFPEAVREVTKQRIEFLSDQRRKSL